MKWIVLILVFASTALAVNRIHDARYNFYPEIFVPDDGALSGGAWTHFKGDIGVPLGLKFGITDKLELGSKLLIQSVSNFSQTDWIGDVGVKFRYSSYEAIQMDVLFGLGSSGYEGVAVGYTTLRKYTSKVFSYYDVRLGFFEGLKGPQGLFVQEMGAYPEIRFHDSFYLQLGLTESFNIAGIDGIRETFSLDMIPGLSYQYNNSTKFLFHVTMGIFGPQQNDYRFTLSASTGI